MATDTEQFLATILPRLKAAELANLNGDVEPRIALWTSRDPAGWLGQFGTLAFGAGEVVPHFRRAAERFADGSLLQFDVRSADVIGDAAYLVTIEQPCFRIDGGAEPVSWTQRVSRVFRREGSAWRCAHGHADIHPAILDLPWKPPRH